MNILQKLFSRRYSEKNKIRVIAALIIMLSVSFLLCVFFGSAKISIHDAFMAFLNENFEDPSLRICLYLRLPRAIAAILTGAALAVSGCILQAVLNNSMASPNIIGVNSGAGLAVSILIAIAPSRTELLPLCAFLGALGACILIYTISVKTNSSRLTITLVGITVSSILSAGINTVKTIFPDSIYNANTFMVGGLSGVSYSKLNPAWIIILVTLFVAYILSRDTDIISLGEESAASLGMNVKMMRFLLLTTASILAGSAVSICGLLGFVGLLGPHISRRLVGNSHRYLIPASAMTGGILVSVCDLVGRVIFAPYEISVGIILSFIGGPFFIMLILMQRKTKIYD